MAFYRNTVIIFGLYLIAWTLVVSGRAIEGEQLKAARPPGAQGDDLLPPLIFPTDKQKNNIVPINKTAIKILMHEDDIYNTSNSDSTMTKDGHNKDTLPAAHLTSSEADDLQKTDREIATLEEQRAEFAKTHPLATDTGKSSVSEAAGVKDQVENIQEVKPNAKSELEEQYNRSPANFMSVSVLTINQNDKTAAVRDHLAWISIAVVGILGLTIYAVLMLWRNKLEQRYGNRHRLFTEEDTL